MTDEPIPSLAEALTEIRKLRAYFQERGMTEAALATYRLDAGLIKMDRLGASILEEKAAAAGCGDGNE